PLLLRTSNPQAYDLIHAQSSKEPYHSESPNHRQRVIMNRATMTGWEIRLFKIEPCPKQLSPHIAGNEAGVGCNTSPQTSGRRKAATRIKASRYPFPLLDVSEKRTKSSKLMDFRFWRQRRPDASEVSLVDLGPFPDLHAAERGDRSRRAKSRRIFRRS